MALYMAKAHPLRGTSWEEVAPQARALLRAIERRTRRRPYIRSAYFRKDKVFITYFWSHLSQKPFPEQLRRLRYLPCAIELVRSSRHTPRVHKKRSRPDEIYHRFFGQAHDGDFFCVQINENHRTGRKELMSIFPTKNPPLTEVQ